MMKTNTSMKVYLGRFHEQSEVKTNTYIKVYLGRFHEAKVKRNEKEKSTR
jgi:hypothetical protein